MALRTLETVLVIPVGQSASRAAHARETDLVRIYTDPAAQGTAFRLLVAPGRFDAEPAAEAFVPLVDIAGAEVAFPVLAGGHVTLPRDLARATGWLKVQALVGTVGSYTPQAQGGAQRTFRVIGVYD